MPRIDPLGGLCGGRRRIDFDMKHIDIFTLVPEAFTWFLAQHPVSHGHRVGRGGDSACTTSASYSPPPHHEVDDTPYGGGPGMVTRVDVVAAALEGVFRGASTRGARTLATCTFWRPEGAPFDHALAWNCFESERDLVLLCGRFEGFDARVEACSPPARSPLGRTCSPEARSRRWPWSRRWCGICPARWATRIASSKSRSARSLEGMVEYPHYTRPREFGGVDGPVVLLSGDHAAIARWRRENARPSPWECSAQGRYGGRKSVPSTKRKEDRD